MKTAAIIKEFEKLLDHECVESSETYTCEDLVRETAEDNTIWKVGSYCIFLLAASKCEPNLKAMVALYKAGYSHQSAFRYTIMSQRLGCYPIGSGSLNAMEERQNYLIKFGLKTKICYTEYEPYELHR